MKNKTIRVLAVVLLVSMLSGSFMISCKNTGDGNGTTAPTTTENVENTTAENTENTTAPDETTTATPTQPEERPEDTVYKYVAVIGVDGAGAFFENANTPNIDKIFEGGAVTYKCLTANPTISAQCWGSLLHGVIPSVHGLTNAIVKTTPYPTDSKFPSFFKVIRENDANAKLASFSHWNPINVGIVEDGIGVHKVGDMSDAALTTEICNYVSANNPTALFVQFDEADGSGHSNGYGTAAQLQKITELDSYIGRIYDAYEKKGILDETLFIVTADHGGSGTSHGGLTDAEKYVMFAASGKTVKKGKIDDIEIRDTAAIVLYALGYEAPETWTARVPSGFFKGVTAGERPVYIDKDSERYHESEPTPEANSAGYITNYIKDHALSTYLTFDGDITDACGGNITSTGNLYFVEGYFGQGVSLDDGHVSINNHTPGKDSFTVAFWINTEGMDSVDPCIFSNKDWMNGKNNGYVLSLRYSTNLRFNFGDGSNRIDADIDLPANFREGWMHVIAIVDRENAKISLCTDFGVMTTTQIPANLKDDVMDAFSALNLGQDGTGNYKTGLAATLDEFMIFDGAFDRDDIAALSEYYGKAIDSPDYRDNAPAQTPAQGSDKYITNFVDKELEAYLTFDGNVSDSAGKSTTTPHGTLAYEDGFFGQGVKLDNGYVSLENYAPGTESFTAAFWIKTEGVVGDPSIISNKSWQSGKNKGYIVSLREENDIKVNFGDGSNRVDIEYELPGDYQSGWMYVVVVFDRENGEIRISYDFNDFVVLKITDNLKNTSADAYNVLNIGQDGTGELKYPLLATLDELMLFKGALDSDDVKALAEYFGVEKN